MVFDGSPRGHRRVTYGSYSLIPPAERPGRRRGVMLARYLVITAASVLATTAVAAQTHGQLLESAIFAEDTAGDSATALRIYERLANAPSVPSDIAARARTRLAIAQQTRTPTGLPGQVDPPP